MFIIAAGGNALSPFERVGAHKRARFTILPVVFRCAFCSIPGLAEGYPYKRGAQRMKGTKGRDGTPTAIITWHFVLRPQGIFSSPPFRPWRTRLGLPHERDPSLRFRIVSRLTKGKQRDWGVNVNEFTVLESVGKIYERRVTICMLTGCKSESAES